MRIGKLTKYYFAFWLFYLPLAGIFAFLTEVGFIGFSSFVGFGALGLLGFLTLVLIVNIVFDKEHSVKPSTSVTSLPPDELEGFRNIFEEVKQ